MNVEEEIIKYAKPILNTNDKKVLKKVAAVFDQ